MEIELLTEGQAFRIFTLCWSRGGVGDCPALDFLEQVSTASRKAFLNLLKQCSESGPILNEQKSRYLEEGIYEFKSRQGDRLLYFYSIYERRQIIITHGFRKGARIRTEIERAISLRREYLQSLR